MSTARKNLTLIVWFLFMLSLIMSAFAIINYSSHAVICHDPCCAVCHMVQSVDGVLSRLKSIVIVLLITAVLFVLRLLWEKPMPSLFALSPVSRKTKQLN